MKNLLLLLIAFALGLSAHAQSIKATWELSDTLKLSEATLSGSNTAVSLVTPGFKLGDKIAKMRPLTASGANDGYEPVQYTPPFTAFSVATRTTTRTDGHFVAVSLTPAEGHSFKPTSIGFDAVKVGTDAGAVEVYYTIGDGEEVSLGTFKPARNKITSTNSTGYSHFDITLGEVITKSQPLTVYIYLTSIMGVDNKSPKELGLRCIEINGALDEGINDASKYIESLTFTGAETFGQTKEIDLFPAIQDLKNGEFINYANRLYTNEPTDFTVKTKEGYTATTTYEKRTLTVNVFEGESKVLTFGARFRVTNMQPKAPAKPLNRGLMALSLTGAKMGTGNLVSWRHREADDYEVKYKVYRGESADNQDYILNDGRFVTDRTNLVDPDGTETSFYRLETYDANGNLVETEVSRQTWANQTFKIPTQAPEKDPVHGGTYTPNDASYCDMDGDGEYEIILKWSPSNEKDAASTGDTSPAIFDCYKLDGTLLWRINPGYNFFTSAHTMQFIAWDFDGDGYGEFMMKTAPGTIDGEGNYVLLGNDDPNVNLLSGRGKQDHGPEYITVFDGLTGGELATIPYHTDYATGRAVWGDNNQNRSERYLAALAYLDGPDHNPSPIFARGYYSGAFVAAYDWDGKNLTERWVSRNTESGKGLWGEGAHWISVGDCDGDGKQEIVYGSAALDHDGSLLYRTGLGHGDALHLGDFLPDRPGLEVFMVHEEKPYGYDLRDAKTGERILYQTAGGDTGRGIAAHFDKNFTHSQFSHSAEPGMHDCLTGEMYAEGWNPGGGGSMNNRIYWTGDLYDEHYDKSVLAKWNGAGWDRVQVNKGNYTIGKLNNGSKYNPCVLGDFLGDWREEILLWEETTKKLIINATSYPSEYRLPHLMDDLNYRVQVVNQNCCYNQPPHLSFDPSHKYADNPNHATPDDPSQGITDVENAGNAGPDTIYTIQGIRIERITSPGLYIINGKKTIVR
ncbi:MAG: hypothetical protein K1V80_07845 [Muribaculaceae bacterium]